MPGVANEYVPSGLGDYGLGLGQTSLDYVAVIPGVAGAFIALVPENALGGDHLHLIGGFPSTVSTVNWEIAWQGDPAAYDGFSNYPVYTFTTDNLRPCNLFVPVMGPYFCVRAKVVAGVTPTNVSVGISSIVGLRPGSFAGQQLLAQGGIAIPAGGITPTVLPIVVGGNFLLSGNMGIAGTYAKITVVWNGATSEVAFVPSVLLGQIPPTLVSIPPGVLTVALGNTTAGAIGGASFSLVRAG